MTFDAKPVAHALLKTLERSLDCGELLAEEHVETCAVIVAALDLAYGAGLARAAEIAREHADYIKDRVLLGDNLAIVTLVAKQIEAERVKP